MICPMCEKEFAGSPSDILPGKDVCPECAENIRTLVKGGDVSARKNALAYIRDCKARTHDKTVYDAIASLEKKNNVRQLDVEPDANSSIEAQQAARQYSLMFDHVGEKIMKAAGAICGVGIGAFIVVGIIMFLMGATRHNGAGLMLAGVVVAVFGPMLAWVVSLMVYGYGEMVNNSRIRTELARKNSQQK